MRYYYLQEEDEQKYLAMMQTVAALPWMYYSPTLDLTNSFQRQAAETYDKNAPMWKRVSYYYYYYLRLQHVNVFSKFRNELNLIIFRPISASSGTASSLKN